MSDATESEEIQRLFARYGPSYRWLVTLTAMLGTFSMVLTATIVNVALPDIMGDLGIGQDTAQLLSTGFLAAMTGAMLLNAWLVERLGLRATYTLAVSLFIAAAFVGGLAPNAGVLIAARVVQGAAAGVLQPLAMQVIFQVFPPERRGSAMGIYGFGVVLGPALGPTLGGILVDALSWRYVFAVAIPFCIVGLCMGMLFMPRRQASAVSGRFDWLGFGLISLFLLSLLTGLSNGERDGWLSALILAELSIAAISGVAFLWWQWRSPAPLLDLQVFNNRAYAGAAIVAFIFGAGIYGSIYLLPLFVQTMHGYSPTDAGLLLMPAGLTLAMVFPLAGRVTDWLPEYQPLMLGLFLFAVSSWLLVGVASDTPFWTLVWWIVLGRIGLGFMLPSLNAGALKALPAEKLGQGTGAINFVRQLGGALGVNLLAIFLHIRSRAHIDELPVPAGQELVSRAELEAIASAQGNIPGYQDAFLLVAVVFLIALLPAWMMRQSGSRTRPVSP